MSSNKFGLTRKIGVSEVDPAHFISEASVALENIVPEIPEIAMYKTGVHRELAPQDPKFQYIRTSSIIRKLAVSGTPVGVSRISRDYGGSVDRGSKRNRHHRGARGIIRKIFQTLDKAGLTKSNEDQGRILTPKGYSFVDKTITEVLKKITKGSGSQPEPKKNKKEARKR